MIEFKLKVIIKTSGSLQYNVKGTIKDIVSDVGGGNSVRNALPPGTGAAANVNLKDGDLILIYSDQYPNVPTKILNGEFPEPKTKDRWGMDEIVYKIFTYQYLDTFKKLFNSPYKEGNIYDVTDLLAKGMINVNQLRADETLIGEQRREQIVQTNCDMGIYTKLTKMENFPNIKKELDPDVIEIGKNTYYKEPGNKVTISSKDIFKDIKE